MALPADRSPETQQYTMVFSSQSHAYSPEDALGMFFAQMGTGNVAVEIHNADTKERWDVDDLGEQNDEDQLNLALAIIARHASGKSNHEKLALVAEVDKALGLARSHGT